MKEYLVLVFACKLAWSMLCYSNTSWCHYRACGQWLWGKSGLNDGLNLTFHYFISKTDALSLLF
jgi:hypothetical protein